MSVPTPEEYAEMDDIDDEAMMEIWVSRGAVEVVVQAAIAYQICSNNGKDIDLAVRSIQDAVYEGGYDPLRSEPDAT